MSILAPVIALRTPEGTLTGTPPELSPEETARLESTARRIAREYREDFIARLPASPEAMRPYFSENQVPWPLNEDPADVQRGIDNWIYHVTRWIRDLVLDPLTLARLEATFFITDVEFTGLQICAREVFGLELSTDTSMTISTGRPKHQSIRIIMKFMSPEWETAALKRIGTRRMQQVIATANDRRQAYREEIAACEARIRELDAAHATIEKWIRAAEDTADNAATEPREM